jgi:hypothetical protein
MSQFSGGQYQSNAARQRNPAIPRRGIDQSLNVTGLSVPNYTTPPPDMSSRNEAEMLLRSLGLASSVFRQASELSYTIARNEEIALRGQAALHAQQALARLKLEVQNGKWASYGMTADQIQAAAKDALEMELGDQPEAYRESFVSSALPELTLAIGKKSKQITDDNHVMIEQNMLASLIGSDSERDVNEVAMERAALLGIPEQAAIDSTWHYVMRTAALNGDAERFAWAVENAGPRLAEEAATLAVTLAKRTTAVEQAEMQGYDDEFAAKLIEARDPASGTTYNMIESWLMTMRDTAGDEWVYNGLTKLDRLRGEELRAAREMLVKEQIQNVEDGLLDATVELMDNGMGIAWSTALAAGLEGAENMEIQYDRVIFTDADGKEHVYQRDEMMRLARERKRDELSQIPDKNERWSAELKWHVMNNQPHEPWRDLLAAGVAYTMADTTGDAPPQTFLLGLDLYRHLDVKGRGYMASISDRETLNMYRSVDVLTKYMTAGDVKNAMAMALRARDNMDRGAPMQSVSMIQLNEAIGSKLKSGFTISRILPGRQGNQTFDAQIRSDLKTLSMQILYSGAANTADSAVDLAWNKIDGTFLKLDLANATSIIPMQGMRIPESFYDTDRLEDAVRAWRTTYKSRFPDAEDVDRLTIQADPGTGTFILTDAVTREVIEHRSQTFEYGGVEYTMGVMTPEQLDQFYQAYEIQSLMRDRTVPGGFQYGPHQYSEFSPKIHAFAFTDRVLRAFWMAYVGSPDNTVGSESEASLMNALDNWENKRRNVNNLFDDKRDEARRAQAEKDKQEFLKKFNARQERLRQSREERAQREAERKKRLYPHGRK